MISAAHGGGPVAGRRDTGRRTARLVAALLPALLVAGPRCAPGGEPTGSTDTAPIPADIAAEMGARRAELRDAVEAHKQAGRPMYDFRHDWAGHLSSVAAELAREKEPARRQALLISYLDLGFGAYGTSLDRELSRKALVEIPPGSALWSHDPDLLGVAARYARDPEKSAAYLRRVVELHPDPEVRRAVETRYGPDRDIMPGKPVPPFDFESLDDPGTRITERTFPGKVYLIDFWATWCVPCIEALDEIEQAYEEHADRFDILSLSLDESADTVREFRRTRRAMPWRHAMVEDGFQSPVLKTFEISGLPKPILVGPTGIILATGDDLRGPRFRDALMEALEGRP